MNSRWHQGPLIFCHYKQFHQQTLQQNARPRYFTDDQFDLISMTQQALTILFHLISIFGITRVVGKSLAVALCMIDLFVKWLESEVAIVAGGYRSLWGSHQLLTATDKLPLAPGIHTSKVLKSGQTWHWNIMSQSVLFYPQTYYYSLRI